MWALFNTKNTIILLFTNLLRPETKTYLNLFCILASRRQFLDTLPLDKHEHEFGNKKDEL